MSNTKENHLHDTEYRWFAVYVQSRSEKVVFRRLKAKGINAYLPLQKLVRTYGSRKRTVEIPLITCYVFVKITKAEYVKVLETEGVVAFVKIVQNLISIPEAEIETMRKLLGEGWNVEQVNTNEWKEGDTVEISKGRLVGTRGKLIDVNGKKTFTIELETLGVGLAIEVDKDLLVKV